MPKRTGRRRALGFLPTVPVLSASRSRVLLPQHVLAQLGLEGRDPESLALGWDSESPAVVEGPHATGLSAGFSSPSWQEYEMGQNMATLSSEARKRDAEADEELREVEAKLELLRYRAAHRARQSHFWTQVMLFVVATAGLISTTVLGLLYYDAHANCVATHKPLVEGLADGAQRLATVAARLAHGNHTRVHL